MGATWRTVQPLARITLWDRFAPCTTALPEPYSSGGKVAAAAEEARDTARSETSVAEVELDRHETPQGSRLEMSHDGYARRHGLIHRRLLILSPNGRELRGEDMLLPAPRTRRKGDKGFALRFHLGRNISASLTADKLKDAEEKVELIRAAEGRAVGTTPVEGM